MSGGWYTWSDLRAQLDRIEAKLLIINKQETAMAIDLTGMTAELAKNTNVSASAVVAINTLLAQLAALPPSTDPMTQAAIDNIVANWQANDNTVAAAIANTPQNPIVVPPVVVVPPAATKR